MPDIDYDHDSTESNKLGELVKRERRKRGLDQELLGTPKLSAAYIDAVERGRVVPSPIILEYIASQLLLPLEQFRAASETDVGLLVNRSIGYGWEPDISALQEDLNYQHAHAHMLIRSNCIEEALGVITTAQEMAARYSNLVSPSILYRPYYLRGLCYHYRDEPVSAQGYFENALRIEGISEEESATIRNMLGVTLYMQGKPVEALEHHQYCRYAIQRNIVKDLGRKLIMLRNLANDYWALQHAPQALGAYREALDVLDDVDSKVQRADIYWAMSMALELLKDKSAAKLYASKALDIYVKIEDKQGAATMWLYLAEMFTADNRYVEALELLSKADGMLSDGNDRVLYSNLQYAYADVFRLQGNLDAAATHSHHGLEAIKQAIDQAAKPSNGESDRAESIVKYSPINLYRTYVQALHRAALVEEALGNRVTTDELFATAKEEVEKMQLAELKHTILMANAEILAARGDFKAAMEQYRLAAQT